MRCKFAVKGMSMSGTTKRRGFAMIMAIFVVLLVAAGGVLLLSNASRGVKSVSDTYLRTQAELLAESATEFAVMRAQGFDTSVGAGGHCLEKLNIDVKDASGASSMFDINVVMRYSFAHGAPGSCTNVLATDTNLSTMILVDVSVTDHNLSTEPIRVYKRSWQKL